MKLSDLKPAIAEISAKPVVTDLRGHTYLTTYPEIVSFGEAPEPIDERRFRRLAAMAYGWMPRILRIDADYAKDAVVALNAAKSASAETASEVPIEIIASCLHSVVGASKVLHFVNPSVFPIWDSKIEDFRDDQNSNINSAEHYLRYVGEVHKIRAEPDFPSFYTEFCAAYSNRLVKSGIDPYVVTEVRAVEAAAFELAS